MTPDVYVNLQVLNCTNMELTTTYTHSYQMYLWPAAINLPPQSYSQNPAVYPMVFYSGDGQGDDAGNLTLQLGTTLENIEIYGGSNSSGHYITITLPQAPQQSPYLILGLVTENYWPTSSNSASSVSWFPFGGGSAIPFGPLGLNANPQTEQTIAFVDLSQIYPSAEAANKLTAIQNGALALDEQADLWAQVSAYSKIIQPSLTYTLIDVVYGTTPPTQTNQQTVNNISVSFDSGSFQHTYTVENNYESTITLEASSAWTFGAEVSVETSLFDVAVNTSFEAGSSEATTTAQAKNESFSVGVELDTPGTYQINLYLTIDDNYSTSFTGTLQVVGTVATNAINGTVLLALAQTQDWAIPSSDVTLTPSSVTATVSGTVTGNIAYNAGYQETRIS